MRFETLSDEGLLARSREGCASSFSELYQRHQGRLYRFVLQMTGSAPLAEEVTQEVFLLLLEDRHPYDAAKGSLLPFLIGVARNKALRTLKKEQPYLSLDEPEENPAEPAVEATHFEALLKTESLELLEKAVQSLPAAYREVLVLCELEELDYAQAAQALGCAIGTIRSRLHRARGMLLERWAAASRPRSMRCPV